MSGIAGIVYFDGAPVAPGQIEKMTAAMASRGPDGIQHWVKGSVALGQCMLRTTPESLEENQPLANEDSSLVLVMDGRVDNFEELRRELLGRGAVLRDRSDAELVLRAYEIWGEACPDKIIGECVFFIWDARQRRLFGARDAAGTRHFYYHAGKGWFGFASEIKGLLALGKIDLRLNESRLLDYLVVQYDRDDEVGTFYQGISRLPAGHAMRIGEQEVTIWRYWHPSNLPEQHFTSLDECAEAFLEQFRIAVKCRLRSVGPVGAMLSGGLDSSSIVGLISKEFRGNLQQPLRTFSLIREDRENCHDWNSIKEILQNDKWLSPTLITSSIASEYCHTYFEEIENIDEPFALTSGLLESFVVDAAHNNGCRVLFDGMAGDLLFYNMEHSLRCGFENWKISLLPTLLVAFRRHGFKNGIPLLLRMGLRSAMPRWALESYKKHRDNNCIVRNYNSELPGDLLGILHTETARQYLEKKYEYRNKISCNYSGSDQKRHAKCFEAGTISFAHEVNGEIGLAKGVEPRSPFSDRRMIEFSIRMPLEAKLSLGWYKYLLRKSMVGILPEGVRWRRVIAGHPGWVFYKQFIAETALSVPETWNEKYISKNLGRWISPLGLDQMWQKYNRTLNDSAGYNLFVLFTLTKWMDAQTEVMKFSD